MNGFQMNGRVVDPQKQSIVVELLLMKKTQARLQQRCVSRKCTLRKKYFILFTRITSRRCLRRLTSLEDMECQLAPSRVSSMHTLMINSTRPWNSSMVSLRIAFIHKMLRSRTSGSQLPLKIFKSKFFKVASLKDICSHIL